MRPGVLASILLGAAACGQPAIKLSLGLVQDNGFDYSCIAAVDVMPIPVGYHGVYDISSEYNEQGGLPITCIDLPHAPKSLTDLANELHDKVDVPIPAAGLAGVELRARVGHCGDATDTYREAIVYGGGAYTGGNALTVQLAHNLYCGESQPYKFHAVDLMAMATSHACDPPPAAGEIEVGDIRPTNIVPSLEFEVGAQYAEVGSGDPTLSAYPRSYTGSCPAVDYFLDDGLGNLDDTASCILPSLPRLCEADAIDVPYISLTYLDNSSATVTPMVGTGYQPPVLVAVYTDQNGQKVPVAGATVTAKGGNAKLVFGDLGNPTSGFAPAASTQQQTTSSGLVMAYLHGITELDVTAPGPNGTTLAGFAYVGPSVWRAESAALIVVK